MNRRLAAFVLAVGTLGVAGLLRGVAVAPAANGDCGQPVSSGDTPSVPDCFYVLRASVGLVACELCVCDINDSQTNSTADALQCMRAAVGQSVSLNCPSCEGTGDTSTTSTSTTSTTTTIPVRCDGNGDCAALPDPFRCNPNTETCEKPCNDNGDCKDFYECNQSTGYCQEPALQF